MEQGSIERDIHIAAPPEIVYDVVSTAEHIQGWWSDEIEFGEAVPGAAGELAWSDGPTRRAYVQPFVVVEADRPRRFSFRWVFEGEPVTSERALLVTFELTPSGAGTLLRMTETGFREMGWETAKLEQMYTEHVNGWNHYVPRLAFYAADQVPAR